MLDSGFESRLGLESSGVSMWHFLKLIVGCFLRVHWFPPLLRRLMVWGVFCLFLFLFFVGFVGVFLFYFIFFCVPQLYLWGSPLLGEIFAYVTVF